MPVENLSRPSPESDDPQLSWEQQLDREIYRLLDDPGPAPRIRLSMGKKHISASSRSSADYLGGRDYTRIRRSLDGAQLQVLIYVPEPGLEAHSAYRADQAPLKYSIRVGAPGRARFVASSLEVQALPRQSSDSFEAFKEADGTCSVYRIDQGVLRRLGPEEGEMLLSEVVTSVPVLPTD